MKKLGITLVMPAILLLMGCSSSSQKQEKPASSVDIMDVLTDFSIAINEDNYEKAAAFLVAGESERLRGSDGRITDENKKKLKALRLHKLIKNPNIKLSRGKLTGIYNSLPILEHGQVEEPDISSPPTAEDGDAKDEEEGMEDLFGDEEDDMGPGSQAPDMDGENADASVVPASMEEGSTNISATPDEFPDPESE